tara:strand:+ start:10474 stop:10656 length:183 start_codon:yes stop_codon:yes gene_type:complete
MTNRTRKVIESGETYKDFLVHHIQKAYHQRRLQGVGEHQALKDTLDAWLKNNPAVSENKN